MKPVWQGEEKTAEMSFAEEAHWINPTGDSLHFGVKEFANERGRCFQNYQRSWACGVWIVSDVVYLQNSPPAGGKQKDDYDSKK